MKGASDVRLFASAGWRSHGAFRRWWNATGNDSNQGKYGNQSFTPIAKPVISATVANAIIHFTVIVVRFWSNLDCDKKMLLKLWKSNEIKIRSDLIKLFMRTDGKPDLNTTFIGLWTCLNWAATRGTYSSLDKHIFQIRSLLLLHPQALDFPLLLIKTCYHVAKI